MPDQEVSPIRELGLELGNREMSRPYELDILDIEPEYHRSESEPFCRCQARQFDCKVSIAVLIPGFLDSECFHDSLRLP